uniref:Uncharacterized protein n=1 Tax=Romanomermis culicivorax TaxID=13658 RepID=A0A915J2X0_ROMCU
MQEQQLTCNNNLMMLANKLNNNDWHWTIYDCNKIIHCLPYVELKLAVNFFCGCPRENVDLFMNRFNRQCQANNYADDQKRLIFPSLLQEAAEVVYHNIPTAEKQMMT